MIFSSDCFTFIVSRCSSIKDRPLKNNKMNAIGKKKTPQKNTHFQLPAYSKYDVVLFFKRAKFLMSSRIPIGQKITRKKTSQKILPRYLKELLDIFTVRIVFLTLFIITALSKIRGLIKPPHYKLYTSLCLHFSSKVCFFFFNTVT